MRRGHETGHFILNQAAFPFTLVSQVNANFEFAIIFADQHTVTHLRVPFTTGRHPRKVKTGRDTYWLASAVGGVAKTISIRRFFARPSRVSLSAKGLYSA